MRPVPHKNPPLKNNLLQCLIRDRGQFGQFRRFFGGGDHVLMHDGHALENTHPIPVHDEEDAVIGTWEGKKHRPR